MTEVKKSLFKTFVDSIQSRPNLIYWFAVKIHAHFYI